MPWAPKSRAAQQREKERKQASDAKRGTFRERGYSTQWSKASLAYREQNPLCAHCEAAGKLTPVECVDHIEACTSADENFWLESNWVGLCWSCHSSKTCRVDGGFGRRRINAIESER